MIDFKTIRQLVPIRQVLTRLGWEPVGRPLSTLRGPCPIHVSSSERSRSLAVDRDHYYCHVCHARGDVIDLWARLRCLSIPEAARELCRTFGMTVPLLRSVGRGTEKRNG